MGAPSASTTFTWVRSGLPQLGAFAARAAQAAAAAHSGRAIPCTVNGYTALGVQRVGGASVLLELAQQRQEEIRDGVFVFGIRSAPDRRWLPAIAALPGETPSRSGQCRAGLAEVMVLARPVAAQQASRTIPRSTGCSHVTFLAEPTLRELYRPESTSVEVVELLRVGPFRDGMSGGPWLLDRLTDATARAETEIRSQLLQGPGADAADTECLDPSALLRGTGLRLDRRLEDPPERAEGLGADVDGDALCGGGVWRSPARGFDQIQHEI